MHFLKRVDKQFLIKLISYIHYFEEKLCDLEYKGKLSETQLKCYWDYYFILTNYICFQGEDFPDCSAVNDEKYFKPHPSEMVEKLMDEVEKSQEQVELWDKQTKQQMDDLDKKIEEYKNIPEEERNLVEDPFLDDMNLFLIRKYQEGLAAWRAYNYELLCLHCLLDVMHCIKDEDD